MIVWRIRGQLRSFLCCIEMQLFRRKQWVGDPHSPSRPSSSPFPFPLFQAPSPVFAAAVRGVTPGIFFRNSRPTLPQASFSAFWLKNALKLACSNAEWLGEMSGVGQWMGNLYESVGIRPPSLHVKSCSAVLCTYLCTLIGTLVSVSYKMTYGLIGLVYACLCMLS